MDPVTLVLIVLVFITIGWWGPFVFLVLGLLFGIVGTAALFACAYVLKGWNWLVTKITGRSLMQRRAAKAKKRVLRG